MTIAEIYESAKRRLDKNEITIGEFCNIVDITVDGLATYFEIHDNELDKKNGAVINLGHSKTTVSIFEEGKIKNSETLQIGGINIEKDLAYVFGISICYSVQVR